MQHDTPARSQGTCCLRRMITLSLLVGGIVQTGWMVQCAAAPPANAVRTPVAQASTDWEQIFGPRKAVASEQISDQLDLLLSAPAADQKPGVIVFPITDAEGKVRPDGLGFSYQALIAISQATARSGIAVSTDAALEMLIDAGCARIGSPVTQDQRKACMRSMNAQLSVTGTLVRHGSNWELTITLFDADGNPDGKPSQHTMPAGKLNLVPGIVAGEVCQRLKVTPTAAERTAMLEPQVNGDEASALLGRLLTDPLQTPESCVFAERFLRANPQSAGAWRHVIKVMPDPLTAIRWHRNTDLAPQDAHIALAIANRLLQAGFGERSFADLQSVASKIKGDPAVCLQVIRLAQQSGDAKLVNQALDKSRTRDSSYVARYARARLLIEHAEAIAGTAATTATDSAGLLQQQRPHLEAARAELLAAVEMNPQGWQAHNQLISLATALGLPREEMESHFAAVVELLPDNISAYRRKLQYLSPYHRGTIEDVAEFAEVCVKSGHWQAGIPQLMIEAVDLATCNPATAATSFSAFRNERLWQAIQAYYAAAENQPDGPDKFLAVSYYALWACNSGYFREVAKLFAEFAQDYYTERHEPDVFGSHVNYAFMRKTAGLLERNVMDFNTALHYSLNEKGIELLESMLNHYTAELAGRNVPGTRKQLDDLAAAMAVARRLKTDRKVEFTGEELERVVFLQETYANTGSEFHVEGRGVRWSPLKGSSGTRGQIAIAYRHGTVSGQMQATPNSDAVRIHLHAQSMRDTITVNYLFKTDRITVTRSGRQLAVFPLPKGIITFRLQSNATEDIIQPAPGLELRTPVVDDVPGTVAFELATGPEAGTAITIADLQLQLDDE